MAWQDRSPLVESRSRNLATSKPEMEGLLASWQRLYLEQGAPEEQQRDLLQARSLLDRSRDLPMFLSLLQRATLPSGLGASTPKALPLEEEQQPQDPQKGPPRFGLRPPQGKRGAVPSTSRKLPR